MRPAKARRRPTLKPFPSSICRSGYQLFDSPASTLSRSDQRKIPKRPPLCHLDFHKCIFLGPYSRFSNQDAVVEEKYSRS